MYNINNSNTAFKIWLQHCNPWPHVANRHISISQLLSLWRHWCISLTLVLIMMLFSLWHHSLLS